MKKILYSILLFSALVSTSCERDRETDDVSQVSNLANVTVQGDELMSILVGTPYTDLGATAFEGEEELELTTVGSVDASTPGVYFITYSATNSDGFKTVKNRIVTVTTPEVASANLAGKYQRNGGVFGISTWEKVGDGIYKCTDVGGAKLPDQYVYVFNIKENVVVVPNQRLGGVGSNVTCLNAEGGEEITFTPGPIGTTSYKWVVINSGYGTALRSFIRVE